MSTELDNMLITLNAAVQKSAGVAASPANPPLDPLSPVTTQDPLNGLVEGDPPEDLVGVSEVATPSADMSKYKIQDHAPRLPTVIRGSSLVENLRYAANADTRKNPFVKFNMDADGTITSIVPAPAYNDLEVDERSFGAQNIAKQQLEQSTSKVFSARPSATQTVAPVKIKR